jgi:hypothetical protein
MRVVTDTPVTTRPLATAVHEAREASSVLASTLVHHASRSVARWLA